MCFCHGFIPSLVCFTGRREAGMNSFLTKLWKFAQTSAQPLGNQPCGCTGVNFYAGTPFVSAQLQKWKRKSRYQRQMEQEPKEMQSLWCHSCIQAGKKMKGCVYASVAFSLLVPGIILPPEEQRHREAVTSYSCLLMFIWKRCEQSCLCCLRQRK